MNTEIIAIKDINLDEKKIMLAANIIKENGIVAFPTETVYGLGANGLSPKAIDKIYKAKGRPSDNPLILHISDVDMIFDLIEEFPNKAKLIIDKFWPGPLTLIFRKSQKVPIKVTGGLNTVAIRMPNHPVALKLIKECGVPLAAPSANISGKPSPTKGQHVIDDLKGRVEGIIVSNKSEIGLESTVLDITQDIPIILRPGGVTYEELSAVLGQVLIDKAVLSKENVTEIKSPGMKYKHYAPNAQMKIVKGNLDDTIKTINKLYLKMIEEGKKVGILATEQTKDKYIGDIILSIGDRTNPKEIATNLFDRLRQFDNYDIDIILCEGFDNEGIGLALLNRIYKAAGFDIIEV